MADVQSQSDSTASLAEVWIGLVEVYPTPGCTILDSGSGACTNILACALNYDDFHERIRAFVISQHLELWSLEDVAPVRIRRQSYVMDPEIAALATEVMNTTSVKFSTLHTFPLDEGIKPH